MSFLMIRNPGVADYRGFTLLGVSTTRYAGAAGTIGQFGSGSKLAIALLLRHGISPYVITGNLHLQFLLRKELIGGREFNRVCVKFSGKDVDGISKNTTEDMGFMLEWGVLGWTHIPMAVREIVSNAIDGAIVAGGSYRGVEFEVVDKPRAKFGYTAVYLPYNDAIKTAHSNLGTTFLHLSAPHLLNQQCLPKQKPDEDKVLVYKNGVLVCHVRGKSVFDYNLGDELTLDESRNASEWDVRYSVARALRNASPDKLAIILAALKSMPDLWEGKLDASYLAADIYTTPEVVEQRKAAFSTAWKAVAGEKGVVSSGKGALAQFVEKKGFTPVVIKSQGWAQALESYGIIGETAVLSKTEQEGNILSDPSGDMLESLNKVWGLFESFNLTNGKDKPDVKSFYSIMGGEAQVWGWCRPGEDFIALHRDLTAGPMLDKVCLEEVVHYVTGATDGSRDIQDFLFRLITTMAF